MTIKIVIVLLIVYIFFIFIDKLTKSKKKAAISTMKVNKDIKMDVEPIKEDVMVEYTREKSKELGFNKEVGFKRPLDLRRKDITPEQEESLERSKLLNNKFSIAISKLISLSVIHDSKDIEDRTLRVFIDSLKDNTVIARDSSATLELDIGGIYDIAGEFVLINIDMKGGKIKVNYILKDGGLPKN